MRSYDEGYLSLLSDNVLLQSADAFERALRLIDRYAAVLDGNHRDNFYMRRIERDLRAMRAEMRRRGLEPRPDESDGSWLPAEKLYLESGRS